MTVNMPGGIAVTYDFSRPNLSTSYRHGTVTLASLSGTWTYSTNGVVGTQMRRVVQTPTGGIREYTFVSSVYNEIYYIFQYKDENGMTTRFERDEYDRVTRVEYPEGNSESWVYDDRGNILTWRVSAKPGSGLPDRVTMAVFPTSCVNPKTCNQPTSVTDPNGNTTDYTYDPVHGGVRTVTGPAVSGVRPQVRSTYVQRYAWILGPSGALAPAASPIWLLASTSTCRTSAATGNPASPCAAAGDEVRTDFDYGPDASPNNLLLRGEIVTAGGQSLRTCYGYDRFGNRISETRPNAEMTSCP
jgi:YD repeat-containing protein